MLIMGRVVAGIGGAGLANGGVIILTSAAPLERQPGTFTLTQIDVVTHVPWFATRYYIDGCADLRSLKRSSGLSCPWDLSARLLGL